MDPRPALGDQAGYDELLPPRMRRDLKDIENDYVRGYAELAPAVIAAQADAATPALGLSNAVRRYEQAMQRQRVFESHAGPQAVGPSTRARRAVWCLLLLGASVEMAFAFNGVRFGLGQYGQIDWPWQDPLSLGGAVAIAALSMAFAHAAGVNLAWGEPGLLIDPEPVDLDAADFGTPSQGDPLADRLFAAAPTEGVLHAIAPSARGGGVSAAERHRFAQVFRRARPRATYRRAGWLLVALGVALWTANGIMRAHYLDRLPQTSAGQRGGLLVLPVASSAPASDLRETELLIIALSLVVFAGTAMLVKRTHPAPYLRARELDQQVEAAKAAAVLEAAAAADPVRRVAEAQAALQGRAEAARVASENARLPGTRL